MKSILILLQTRQATDFKSTTAAAQALGVEYKEHDISYVFNLKTEHLQDSTQLSEHFGKFIRTIENIYRKLAFISFDDQGY